jgi:SAM-dependent methyltransferase
MTFPKTWAAETYDSKFSFVSAGGAAILARLAARAGERILDLGCGTGELTAQLAAAGADAAGLDADAAMIERARQRFPALRFVAANAETPWPEGLRPADGFDAVFSNAALHWMKPAPVLAHVRAALRPGGRFVGEFGGHGNVASVATAFAEARADAGLPAPPLPWFFPTIATFASLLAHAGFEPCWLELVDRPTPLPATTPDEARQALLGWLAMFMSGSSLLGDADPARSQRLAEATADKAAPRLFRDGALVLDYRRLRFEAVAV